MDANPVVALLKPKYQAPKTFRNEQTYKDDVHAKSCLPRTDYIDQLTPAQSEGFEKWRNNDFASVDFKKRMAPFAKTVTDLAGGAAAGYLNVYLQRLTEKAREARDVDALPAGSPLVPRHFMLAHDELQRARPRYRGLM